MSSPVAAVRRAVARSRAETLPYGALVLERILARAKARDVVTSVFGVREGLLYEMLPQQERAKDFSLEKVRTALDDSLRRLGVDTIDVWQLHNPRMGHIDDDALFKAFQQAFDEQKILNAKLDPAVIGRLTRLRMNWPALEGGVYWAPSTLEAAFISPAHTDGYIARPGEAFGRAFEAIV